MQHTAHIDANSAMLSLIAEFDTFDPAFDNDLEELERQFAELRFAHSHDLN
jgi:hypothetical protein